MIARAPLLAVLLTAALGAHPTSAQTPPEPDDYRSEPYNAPVPATLQGAQVIDGARAIELHAQGVPFLDAYPRKKKPADLPEGTIWREQVHETIPGAVWLWDTGYDRLAEAEQTRLASGLEKATDGDKAAPVVLFCRADCWMSWNAGRRAVEMGYTGVIWFPGGTDGWLQAKGAPLVQAEPIQP